ncbi:MAG: class I SAM-dependent methyltransferase [Rhizobacter sp.]|nr:class I SAM-dependent methyltransferase [Ferruginibacter sp.]
MFSAYNKTPIQTIDTANRNISVFSIDGKNIDPEVVKTFGDEWLKFNAFSDESINLQGHRYFDILDEKMINKNVYGIDIGCGTGRWTKYLSDKVGFIEAVDPSDAVFAADKLLKGVNNVRITKAAVETIPFDDETFDFAMSVGVLHHIPNTQNAMIDCVKKVKRGGYFYCYLYYSLDNRGILFKLLFEASDLIRKIVSRLSPGPKKFVCDVLAVIFYMPFVFLSRFLDFAGFKKMAKKIPLSEYASARFFVIRNDSLDRFGTRLEQRFSKEEVIKMMSNSGLDNIVVGENAPYYCAVGQRK